jgi:hypothetical protein
MNPKELSKCKRRLIALAGLLAVILGSCASEATPPDHAHVLLKTTDAAVGDREKRQSSGAALGSQAFSIAFARRQSVRLGSPTPPSSRGIVL